MAFSQNDRMVLRGLARKVAEAADDPRMPQRRKRWIAHNALRSAYPMMLVFPEGSWPELLASEEARCESVLARQIESALRVRLYGYEHFNDDTVVEKEWIVSKRILHREGWGLEAKRIASSAERGAGQFDPVITKPSDLARLKVPQVTFDEAGSLQDLTDAQDLFGDILSVRLEGIKHISYHLMSQYTSWRGLEEAMVDMYTNPRMLHDAMSFLEDAHRQVLRQYREQNLLALNNDNTYQNSGGNGYTDELPLPDAEVGYVRPCDMWASAESQEMAQVSPEQHAEFALQYEKRLLEPFGLTGYGCCEDLTRKLGEVLRIPHVRRVSISPGADVETCAAKLKGRYIFSWKPNPAHLVGQFDVEVIRAYVRHAVKVTQAHGCILEMVLKDTHTRACHPQRFEEWTRVARQVIEELVGLPKDD